jgi:hypothetical protein
MTTTIELTPTPPDHWSSMLYSSGELTLRDGNDRVRNPGHPHVVTVFKNPTNTDPTKRYNYMDGSPMPPVGDGKYVSAEGHGTDDEYSVLLSARGMVIDGRPHPRVGEVALGDVVELTTPDGSFGGRYEIRSRTAQLYDPILVPVA